MDTSTIERHWTPAAHGADPVAAAASAGRHDMYAGIHKALRLFMTRTLSRVAC